MMKHVKIPATILYQATRIFAWLYLLIGTYALVVIVWFKIDPASCAPMQLIPDNGFYIFYPFTHVPFLTGGYDNIYFMTLIIILFGYGIFLKLLSNVFLAFTREKLFIKQAIDDLKIFYKLNLIVPLALLLLYALLGQNISDLVIITGLHLVIGTFGFFMTAIFQQGFLLQEEQDLTL